MEHPQTTRRPHPMEKTRLFCLRQAGPGHETPQCAAPDDTVVADVKVLAHGAHADKPAAVDAKFNRLLFNI